jgi:MFS family permease
MAIYSIVMSVGFMVAFPAVGSIVQSSGWRAAWIAIGIALIAVLAPLGWIVVRRNPEQLGLLPDGERTAPAADTAAADVHDRMIGYSWQAALLTPVFWVFAIGAALYGLVASGIGLFNESILAEHGFGPAVYYQTLVVTALTALAGNFVGGWLATKMPLARLMAASLFILALGVAALPQVTSVLHVMSWAVVMGLGGGLVMVLFFSVWGRVFGRRQLGRIQGVAQAMTVLASAVGPLLLAWCVTWTGSYAAMFRLLAGIIGLVGVSALIVSMPASPESASGPALSTPR